MCCGKPQKTCLEGCGRIADPKSRSGSRCTECESVRNRARNADPKRRAYFEPEYRAIPRWGTCPDCGKQGRLTVDHVVPLSKGGTNDPENLVLRCRECNSAKGAD